MKRYQLHPEARIEYIEAATYYFDVASELGSRFYDEIEALISMFDGGL